MQPWLGNLFIQTIDYFRFNNQAQNEGALIYLNSQQISNDGFKQPAPTCTPVGKRS